MSPRIIKEAQALAFPCLVTLSFFPVCLLPFLPREAPWVIGGPFLLFSFAMAAMTFGHEFSGASLDRLLSQPIHRASLWKEKMLVLGVALLPVLVTGLLLAVFRQPRELFLIYSFIPICAFCTTPSLTLLSRSAPAAIVFSLAIPCLIAWLAGVISRTFHGDSPSGSLIEQPVAGYLVSMLALYCGFSLRFGYHKWMQLEVTGPDKTTWRSLAMSTDSKPWFKHLQPGPSVRRNLILKELRLQELSLVVAILFIVIEVLIMTYVRLFQPPNGEDYFIFPLLMYVVILPVIVGGVAIAEENNLGVREWHLTLPISTFQQWAIKIAVVMTVSLTLGVVLPLIILRAGLWLLPNLPAGNMPHYLPAIIYIGCHLLATALAFYASSISPSSLRGITLGFVSVVGGFIYVMALRFRSPLGTAFWERLKDSLDLNAGVISFLPFAAILTAVLCLLALVMAFSLDNFKEARLSPNRISVHAILLLALGGLLTFLIHNCFSALTQMGVAPFGL